MSAEEDVARATTGLKFVGQSALPKSAVAKDGSLNVAESLATPLKANELVERLREEILSGALRPGSKISLDKIRREFSVSVAPLREALNRLTKTGLVEINERGSFMVAPMSLANLTEITHLRIELDTLALTGAITTGSLKWESDVMHALHRLNRSVRDPSNHAALEKWEIAHREFHMALISGCGMPVLLDFCAVLHNLTDRYDRLSAEAPDTVLHADDGHAEIAQGAVARDSNFACEKLRRHTRRNGEKARVRLFDHLQLRGGPAKRTRAAPRPTDEQQPAELVIHPL